MMPAGKAGSPANDTTVTTGSRLYYGACGPW